MALLERGADLFTKLLNQREQILANAMLIRSYPRYSIDRRYTVEGSLLTGVIENEYAVISALDERPVIGTSGLETCIAVTVYDSYTHRAGVAHVRYVDSVPSLPDMFSAIQPDQNQWKNLEIRLVGGRWLGSKMIAAGLKDCFDAYGIIPLSADVMYRGRPSQVAVDSRNGKLLFNMVPLHLSSGRRSL